MHYKKYEVDAFSDPNPDLLFISPSVANGDVDKIKHWVGQCKNVDEVDENDRTPLHWAVMHNRIEIAKILLKKKLIT